MSSSRLEAVKYVCLFVFFVSTPISQAFVFLLGKEREKWAIINGYAFSIPMVVLYIYPFFFSQLSFPQKLEVATTNWIIWLSVFTELLFQIPHNLLVSQLHSIQGSALEWPFYSYGLSDSRWNEYNGGSGLDAEVWLINANDFILGAAVAVAMLYNHRRKSDKSFVIFALLVIFRDATLWRETVQYMFDHHRLGYPYTTNNPDYRIHAILILWLVNCVWLVAPIFSVVWAFNKVFQIISGKKGKRN